MKQIIPINATKDGTAPTITEHYHKAGGRDFMPREGINGNKPEMAILEIMEEPKKHVVEPLSCAMRGRNVDNPSDRTVGIPTEQRLEIGSEVANCLTSVQKDSMVIEPCILTPVRTEKAKELRRQGIETHSNRELMPRVDNVSNTITTVQKDNLLQEPIKIRQATAQGYAECPVGGGFDAAYPNSKLRRGRVQGNGDVVGAITASADGHCVYEGAEVSILGYTRDDKGNVTNRHEKDIAGTLHTSTGSGGNTDQFVKEQVIGSMQANAMRGSIDGVSPCLTEAMGMGGGQIPMIVQNGHGFNKGGTHSEVAPTITSSAFQNNNHLMITRYRIRKLTPREVYRLQDVDDADIDRLFACRMKQTLKNGQVKEKPIPKSRHYALAGNSITVSPLYFIFRNMFISEFMAKPKSKQMTLFDDL